MVKTERVEIAVEDGTKMGGYVARPGGAGPFPGIVVIQEIFGVNHHIRNVADRFAREGFVALAPELYHRSAPGYEGGYTDFEPSMAERKKMTPEGTKADLRAAYAWMTHDKGVKTDHVAATGYCMGGNLAFGMNTLVPLQAAISYYGAGIPGTWLAQARDLHGPMLMYWGGLDKHIGIEEPRKVADAVREAGKRSIHVEFSFADHGFNGDERSSYDKESATEAWALTLAFLRLHLG